MPNFAGLPLPAWFGWRCCFRLRCCGVPKCFKAPWPSGSKHRRCSGRSGVRIPPRTPPSSGSSIPRRALFKSAKPRGVVTFVTAAHPHPQLKSLLILRRGRVFEKYINLRHNFDNRLAPGFILYFAEKNQVSDILRGKLKNII